MSDISLLRKSFILLSLFAVMIQINGQPSYNENIDQQTVLNNTIRQTKNQKIKALFNFAIIPYHWTFYEYKAGNPEWQRSEAAIKWS